MDIQTIRKLNALNQEFYAITAEDFSASREYFWSGWQKLLPLIKEMKNIRLLDLGCGNGRFAHFLFEHAVSITEYWGIDGNKALLDIAEKKLAPYASQKKFQHEDIVGNLLDKKEIAHKRFSLITLLGVLHHIPSLQLRKVFIKQLYEQLEKDGFLIFTTWQFQKNATLMKRQLLPQKLGFQTSQLELGDYFLDWQKGSQAVRYCHLCTEVEIEKILAETKFSVKEKFVADDFNIYYVCQK